MPRKKNHEFSQSKAQRTGEPAIARASSGHHKPLWLIGLAAVAGACLLSVVLALASFAAFALPGCGDASPCDQASKSVWGRVPGVGVSVAAVGACYFGAMGLAWLVTRGRLGVALRVVVGVGFAVSVGYVGVMVVEKLFCLYCIASHALHFVFCACAMMMARAGGDRGAKGAQQKATGPWAGAGLALATFLLAFAVAFGVETSSKAKVRAKQEQRLAQSIDSMRSEQVGASETGVSKTADADKTPTIETSASQQARAEQATQGARKPSTALNGRHVWGASEAGIRIVMFTDYQCPDCKLLEAQLTRVQQMEQFKGNVSVAIRHYPVSTLCNPNIKQNMHPDACYAAFASETAGLLGGSDAFWKLHHWLFERKGTFTREALTTQLQSMGMDTQRFFATMESAPIKALVQEDIALAHSLGIAFTPMIFVNGVELRGYTAPDALVRAVTTLAATQPAKAKLGTDVALTARERAMDEFAKSPVRVLPARFTRRQLGPETSDITIVVVGDYEETGTREVDNLLRIFTRGPGETIRYSFVHFPVNQACNPHVQFTKHAKACIAAQASEAAELIAGSDSFWRAHDWLMQQGTMDTLTQASAGAAAAMFVDPATGIEPISPELLAEAMSQEFVKEQIAADAKAALDTGVTSLPAIFINGRLVGTWKVENENLLPAMMTRVREGKTGAGSGERK